MKFIKPNQLNSLDARFSRVMISTGVVLPLYNALELGKYYYHVLPKKYAKQIAERLHDKNLFADKIATVLYDNPGLDILIGLGFCAFILGVFNIKEYINHFPKPIEFEGTRGDIAEHYLNYYIENNGNPSSKYAILYRFNVLNVSDKEWFITKIENDELHHANTENKQYENQILTMGQIIDKIKDRNDLIRSVLKSTFKIEDNEIDVLMVKCNNNVSEIFKYMIKIRLNKNENKLKLYPDLLRDLKIHKDHNLRTLKKSDYIIDYLLQLFFIPEKLRPGVSFSSLSSLSQSESAQ